MNATARRHRIACPYCRVGAAILTIETRGGEIRAEGLDALRCDTCRRFFRIRTQVQFVGVRMESVANPGLAIAR